MRLKYLFWFNGLLLFIKRMKRRMFYISCNGRSLCSAGGEWGALLLFPALWEQRCDSHSRTNSTRMQVCVFFNEICCLFHVIFDLKWSLISLCFRAVAGDAGYEDEDDSLVKTFWLVTVFIYTYNLRKSDLYVYIVYMLFLG